MERKSAKEICLFVRDEKSGRFLFNPEALEALGISPTKVQQRGYALKQSAAVTEAVDVTAD